MNEKKSSLKMLRQIAWATSIALAGSWATATHAQTETANLEVSATVEPSCSISTTALAFGVYDFVTTNNTVPLDATGTVTITCTQDAAVTITLGQGLNADTGSTAAAPLRRVSDGTDFLSYNLYSNAARTSIWGDDATVDVEAVGTGEADPHTVYGRIPGGQNVPSGTYVDTVVATVTF